VTDKVTKEVKRLRDMSRSTRWPRKASISSRCSGRRSNAQRSAERRPWHIRDKVIEHYTNPRNVGSFAKGEANVGTGVVGAPECGDVMKLQLKINPQNGIIEMRASRRSDAAARFASSSYVTELVKASTSTRRCR